MRERNTALRCTELRLNEARRIDGRAVRRAGELLEEFQADTDKSLLRGDEPRRDGGGPSGDGSPQTQRQAAAQAGMSRRQEKQARRVAEVPEEEFEEAIESDDSYTLEDMPRIERRERERRQQRQAAVGVAMN